MIMNREQKRKEDEQGAALALDVLRTLAPNPEEILEESIVLLPSLLPVPRAHAIALLVDQPKPLSCIAATFSRRLAVGWWVRDAAEDRRWIARRKMLMASLLRPHRNVGRTTGKDARIALLVSETETALPYTMCMRWLREYDFLLTTETVAPAKGRLKASGFAATLRFSRTPGSYLEALMWTR